MDNVISRCNDGSALLGSNKVISMLFPALLVGMALEMKLATLNLSLIPPEDRGGKGS